MKRRWGLIVGLLIFTVIVWLMIITETPNRYLTVAFLDVGQGDAILITAPNKNQLLIDGGPGRETVRAIAKVMPFYDRSIDLVMASHPDSDHIGGLAEIFNRYQVAGFISPVIWATTTAYAQLEQAVMAEKSFRLIGQTGTRIILSPEVTLDILLAKIPTLGPRGGQPDTNDSSLVVKLTYASSTFLFTGDAPAKLLDQLARRESGAVKVDVLKVSHHGSKNSSSLFFLKQVDPDLAIISAGADNRYGHPHQEVLAWLRQAGAQTFSTADLSTITLKSDGVTVGF